MKPSEHKPNPPPVPFRTPVPVEEARPGDLTFFRNTKDSKGRQDYRFGDIVESRKTPKGHVALKLRKPGGKHGPVQFVPFKDLLHVYRDAYIRDPAEEEV